MTIYILNKNFPNSFSNFKYYDTLLQEYYDRYILYILQYALRGGQLFGAISIEPNLIEPFDIVPI